MIGTLQNIGLRLHVITKVTTHAPSYILVERGEMLMMLMNYLEHLVGETHCGHTGKKLYYMFKNRRFLNMDFQLMRNVHWGLFFLIGLVWIFCFSFILFSFFLLFLFLLTILYCWSIWKGIILREVYKNILFSSNV